jgi:hypothetical protein
VLATITLRQKDDMRKMIPTSPTKPGPSRIDQRCDPPRARPKSTPRQCSDAPDRGAAGR